MNRHLTKSDLPRHRQWLVEEMQRVNFGRIEGLSIQAGQPVPNSQEKTVREIKIGGQNGPRPETSVEDFQLKQEVLELFDRCDRLQNGVLDVLEIKHGLPFRLLVSETPLQRAG